MPTLAWIALGLSLWTLCGVLAIAVGCAARRGDRLSDPAMLGMDPSIELQPRRRMVVDVTAVARPWAVGAGAQSAVSALVETAGSR
jgi:hypothetical protein